MNVGVDQPGHHRLTAGIDNDSILGNIRIEFGSYCGNSAVFDDDDRMVNRLSRCPREMMEQ